MDNLNNILPPDIDDDSPSVLDEIIDILTGETTGMIDDDHCMDGTDWLR